MWCECEPVTAVLWGDPGLFERGKIQKSELQTTYITLSFEQYWF